MYQSFTRFKMILAMLLLAGSPVPAAEPPDPADSVARTISQEHFTVLPQDGRILYQQVIASARREIRIEICVLEDPIILSYIREAIARGVRVRVIVDQGEYHSNSQERTNLKTYLTDPGGELHLSNPLFPRSFPKVILVDHKEFVLGSACLDSTTFQSYRDFAIRRNDPAIFRELERLFKNDWAFSAPPGRTAPAFNPTPPLASPRLLIGPVNASIGLVSLYQQAQRTLDVYSELLGNPTLESELFAAVARGVRVRLISPVVVNHGTKEEQQGQTMALDRLRAAGVKVHVSGPAFSQSQPYMHARAAIVDGATAYLGSISLSPNSITFNREAGLVMDDRATVERLQAQFEIDFTRYTKNF
jgi:phosphatidylserine/phosphatidylglycerophosphate/cardiolipin synthase-like enzyme